MTTLLTKQLSREVLVGGEPYKVVISSAGVRITEKGHRKGSEISWETLLALSATKPVRTERGPEKSDVPEAIAAEVAGQLRRATEALQRAAAALVEAGDAPAALLSVVDADPVHGRADHRADWFIEPLLTAAEVASVLRISTSSVRHLPIHVVVILGENRYRQSEVRQYLARQESAR